MKLSLIYMGFKHCFSASILIKCLTLIVGILYLRRKCLSKLYAK